MLHPLTATATPTYSGVPGRVSFGVLELSIHFYTHKKYDMVVLISALVLGLGLYQPSHFRFGLIQATWAETRANIKTNT